MQRFYMRLPTGCNEFSGKMKPNRSRNGFTLVELLTAIAVTLVIGATAFSIMFGASEIWDNCVSNSNDIVAFDNFDTDFARDFNSSCPSCGFSGNATNCTFFTFRLSPTGYCTMEKISYSLSGGRIVSSKGNIYPTSAISAFAFNTSTNIPCETFTSEFSSTNSAPAQIAADLQVPHTTLTRRIYMRSAE